MRTNKFRLQKTFTDRLVKGRKKLSTTNRSKNFVSSFVLNREACVALMLAKRHVTTEIENIRNERRTFIRARMY